MIQMSLCANRPGTSDAALKIVAPAANFAIALKPGSMFASPPPFARASITRKSVP